MNSGLAPGIGVYRDIAGLPADAKTFFSAYSGDELCLNGAWFELLLRYSPPAGATPRLYVVRSNAGVVDCILPAMSADDARRPRKLLSLTNFYTMSFAPLLRRDLDDIRAPLDALASYIARERPRWDAIDLRGFIAEDPVTDQMMQAFRRAGMVVDKYSQFDNWYFPTNGISAEVYFKSRPSQVRNTVTRKLKKAQKEHRVDFRLHTSPDTLPEGLQDYEKIYAQSWKGAEAYPEFIPQLLRQAAAQGSLRLGVLRIDGDPAAAQIWLVTGRRATIYKLAYDEKYALLSAGSILTKMMFDRILDGDAVAEVDYGVGSESYKLDWMSACRHVVGLICFNPLSVVGLGYAAWHLAGRVKRRKLGRLVEGTVS